MSLTGYLHPGYAQSLSEFGTPTELPRSGGWFLKRAIPGSSAFDGMGCYPYLACRDWTALAADLDALKGELVTFAAVPEPFGRYTSEDLKGAFPDVLTHFKEHYVADLARPMDAFVSTKRRRRAEKALHSIHVECSSQPTRFIDDLVGLFELTVQKFGITGLRAFSRESIAEQLALPGCIASLARHGGQVVAAEVFFVRDDTAYAHFAGAHEQANALGAVSARHYTEILYFADKVRWIDWGGNAGVGDVEGSLGRFKRGWSTGTRHAYFCGRIFDPERYGRIAQARNDGDAARYFPAYREGEFS